MRRYRDHVQCTVENRKASYFHSLDMFKLDATTTDANATLMLNHLQTQACGLAAESRPSVAVRFQRPANRETAAAAVGSSRLSDASGQHHRRHQPPPNSFCGPAGTVIVVAGGALQPPSADLASALAATGAEAPQDAVRAAQQPSSVAAAVAATSSTAADAGSGQRSRGPRHTNFCAAAHLQAAGAGRTSGSSLDSGDPGHGCGKHIEEEQQQVLPVLGAAKQAAPISCPSSPRSLLFPSFSSLEHTTGSDASTALADGVAACDAAALLPGMIGVDISELDNEDEGMQQRRQGRRAALHDCLEELQSQALNAQATALRNALPPPAFHS